MTLARCGVRISRAITGLFFVSLLSFQSLAATRWDSKGAALAFEEAEHRRAEIARTNQPLRSQYLECATTYRQVYVKDPHYRLSGNAIYQEGLIYQEMADKFGDLEYYRTAAKRFHLLVTDYGGNPNCPDALLRMGAIYSRHLKNEAAAQDAYQRLKTQYGHSNASALMDHGEIAAKPALIGGVPVAIPSAESGTDTTALVQSIRYWSTENYTRVIIDLDRNARYLKDRISNPDRIYFDISDAKLSMDLKDRTIQVADEFLKRIRVGQYRSNTARIVLEVSQSDDYSVSELHDPFRIVIDIHNRGTKPPVSPSAASTSRPNDAIAKSIPNQTVVAANPSAQELKDSGKHPETNIANSAAQVESTKAKRPPLAVTEISPSEPKEARPLPSPSSAGVLEQPEEYKKPDETNRMAVNDAKPPEVRPLPPSPSSGTAVKAEENKRADEIKRTADSGPKPQPPIKPDLSATPKIAPPTSRGDRTLTRMLGLKIGRIVIDPGHGGHDMGTMGPGGLLEKDLVLSLARGLQKLLQEKLGAEVVLTRNDDTFKSLEERTAIANQHQADLFISIHANSSRIRTISGVETYYLDFAKSDAEREVAARENAASDNNIRDLENLIKKIAQADKSAESRELASLVQKNLYSGARRLLPSTQDRGVRSAPFVVLIGANMPSILAEVAFISNPKDERLLKKEKNQASFAKALFSGIEGYVKTLGIDVVHNQASPNK